MFMKVFLLALLFVLACTQIGFQQSFLKTEGQSIVNEEGENFLFRGMGLGGWMIEFIKTTETSSFPTDFLSGNTLD